MNIKRITVKHYFISIALQKNYILLLTLAYLLSGKKLKISVKLLRC